MLLTDDAALATTPKKDGGMIFVGALRPHGVFSFGQKISIICGGKVLKSLHFRVSVAWTSN